MDPYPSLEQYYDLRDRVVRLEAALASLTAQAVDNRDAIRKIGWAVGLAVLATVLKQVLVPGVLSS